MLSMHSPRQKEFEHLYGAQEVSMPSAPTTVKASLHVWELCTQRVVAGLHALPAAQSSFDTHFALHSLETASHA